MPEIKNQFTGGKMNKDLDERLVPNGQYRDAMNIQVATSEGSDVGTAQNILGNQEVTVLQPTVTGLAPVPFTIPLSARVVGSISDEKIDTMYYLLWSKREDYILSWKSGDETPRFIFFDRKLVNKKDVLKFPRNKIITGINVIDGMLFWTDNFNEPRKINIQRCQEGTRAGAGGLQQTRLINASAGIDYSSNVVLEEKHITVIKKGPQVAPGIKLYTSRALDKVYTGIIKISNPSTDLDGSEASFVSYGNSNGWNDFSNLSTEVTSNDEFSDNKFFVRVYDILNGDGTETNFPVTNAGAVQGLQTLTGWHQDSATVSNLVGTKVVLQAYDEDDANAPGLPLTDFAIKGVVTGANSSLGTIAITATTIEGFPPQVLDGEDTRRYVIDLFDEDEKLFEFKFPRFSYRYKYEDGEYSTFAPFTQVAFVPGSFDYHPRKGYNIGMTNKLQEVDLLNMITTETPGDVVAIDILFKDDASPSIYVVDTIRPDDFAPSTSNGNLWFKMLKSSSDPSLPTEPFNIKKEAITSIIPSNQLLRPWDNVPKKALAQDVTGNRVVYANYVQNYDLLSDTGQKYVPNFVVTPISREDDPSSIIYQQNALNPSSNIATNTFKSIKSLREYQLGVVFLDEHGRETPVISNASGTTRLNKVDGDKINRLGVEFSSDDYPQALTHFKFYVKETSSEYYNMAMDRWYSAGDGNIWLAFPSSDRNKIDIDTFLILKKGSDQDTLVKEPARYKVLAIENEAPDFIKTTKRKTYDKVHSAATTPQNKIFDVSDVPLEGLTNFKMNYAAFHATSGQDLATAKEELYIEFGKLGSDQVSDRYKINSVTNSYIDPTQAFDQDEDVLSIELDRQLGADVNFITNDTSGAASSFINNGAIVRVYKYKTENLNKFDGRFFVKIYFDEVFRTNIETTTIGGGTRVSSSRPVYSMRNDMVNTHTDGLNNFLTRTRGQSREKWMANNENWWPQRESDSAQIIATSTPNPYQGDQKGYDQIVYGYYAVDEFAANAVYFRRYREKKYTKHGVGSTSGIDYGIKQTLPSTNTAITAKNRLNNNYNVRALVHLVKGGSSAGTNDIDGSDFVPYKGAYWKDAKDWYKEFGYHTDAKQMWKRYDGYINKWAQGVTSMWHSNWDDTGNGSGASSYDYQPWDWSSTNTDLDNHKGAIIGSTLTGSPVYAFLFRYREDPLGYSSDEKSARDTEVWFIDNGPYEGTNNGASELRWTQSYHAPGSYGDGLVAASSSWSMDIGFGGITPKDWDGDSAITGFWNVGNWNSPTNNNPKYVDSLTEKFTNSLNTNYQFRWKEDPDKTRLFTINGNVTTGGRMRHSDGPALPQGYQSKSYSTYREERSGENHEYQGTSGTPQSQHKDLRSMAEGLSFNLTKRWRVKNIQPPIDNWNPAGAYGLITGGLSLDLVVVDQNGSDNGAVGSSAGSNTVRGYRCSGPGFPDSDMDLRIYLKDISVVTDVTLPDGSVEQQQKTLHEGMGITSFVNEASDNFEPLNPLIVRRIERIDFGSGAGSWATGEAKTRYFEVTLGGYEVPLLQVDHNDLRGENNYMPIATLSNTGGMAKKGGSITFKQYKMNGYSPNSEFNINTISRKTDDNDFGAISAVGYTLEFIEEIQPTELLSENPAIWETEPKDTTELDIYYEACGSIPTKITEKTIASALPIGTKFLISGGAYTVVGYDGDQATVYPPSLPIYSGGPTWDNVEFFRPDDLVVTTTITGVDTGVDLDKISLESNLVNNKYILPWHNCYTFKNGVESNRIRDNFNLPYISNGVKASTTLEQEYKEEHRKYGLIYSGIYNSTSGINNLNQFIAAEKITKDVNPVYGSIQKLHSRNSDLIALCEDKILRIVANKDALFNADGNPQLIATDRVLGQTIPFSGEYGISTNPESFATEGFRAYFTDRVRGAVIRMSMDGLTPISDAGMKDYFRDNLRNATQLIGSYDDRSNEYNLSIKTIPIYPVRIIGSGSGVDNFGL